MNRDLTKGSISRGLILFSLPLMAGNLLQQLYNIVDTIVVGKYVGSTALAAVGSSYTLMTLLTSVLLGLSMGSSVIFSQLFGAGKIMEMKKAVFHAFCFIGSIAVILTAAVYIGFDAIIRWMHIPGEAVGDISSYLSIIFGGIIATFLYNFVAAVLRSVGNSAVPLYFLVLATVMNIGLDLVFVVGFHMGCAGAAWATVIAQVSSAVGIVLYYLLRCSQFCPKRESCVPDGGLMKRIMKLSVLTSVQQSIMNTGILMVQSLVNQFGVAVMAAFAAGVKIDSFAYLPAQDFANGFATFVSQNDGAGQEERIRRGIRISFLISSGFCLIVSAAVFLWAEQLLQLFIDRSEIQIIEIGVHYLRMEGVFYVGIGMLFLFYAIFRGLERPGISVVLTVISLGTRVGLAYAFAPVLGLDAIWAAIPIGWFLADAAGWYFYRRRRRQFL